MKRDEREIIDHFEAEIQSKPGIAKYQWGLARLIIERLAPVAVRMQREAVNEALAKERRKAQ